MTNRVLKDIDSPPNPAPNRGAARSFINHDSPVTTMVAPRLKERLAMAMRLAFLLSSRPISAEPVTIADPTP